MINIENSVIRFLTVVATDAAAAVDVVFIYLFSVRTRAQYA